MQEYQMTKWSRKFGGGRTVFTGENSSLTSGQYDTDIDTLPDIKDGFVPAGTPIKADDAERTIEIFYAFETNAVTAYTSGDTSFSVQVKKGWEGSRARVGMVLGECPASDLTAEVTDPLTITAIDRTNTNYDSITVSCSARTSTQIAEGTVLVELKKDSNDDYYVKVLPNALLPYDVVKDPNVLNMYGLDGLFCHPNGVLLTRRIPVIPSIIRTYMRAQDVYVRYSESKE